MDWMREFQGHVYGLSVLLYNLQVELQGIVRAQTVFVEPVFDDARITVLC